MRLIVMKIFFISAFISTVLFGSSAFAMELSEDDLSEDVLLEFASNYSNQGQYSQAVQIYEELRKTSHSNAIAASACNELANCYMDGRGVQKNPTEAMKLYQESAQNGNMIGQYNWALYCFEGEYVRQDTYQALLYFGRAAEQGDEVSQASISEIIADYEKHADGGDLAARDLLALLPPEYKQKFFVNQRYPQKEQQTLYLINR